MMCVYIRLLMIVGLSVALSACLSPIKSDLPQEQVYRLSPQVTPVTDGQKSGHVYVPLVEVNPALRTERIVLSKADNQLDFIAHSRWAEQLDVYLQALAVEGLSQANAFQSVSSRLLARQHNYRLLLRFQDFQAAYPPEGKGSATVLITAEATLVRVQDQRIVIQRRYVIRKPGVEVRTSHIVAAMNQGLGGLLQTLAQDLSADLH